MAVILIQIQSALIEFKGINAARVHHLNAYGLGAVQYPSHVIVDGLLVLLAGQHAQKVIVVAQHGVSAFVYHGRVAHLQVRLPGVNRHQGRFKRCCVAHFYIAKAGLGTGGRSKMAAARRANVRFRFAVVFAGLKFWQEHAGNVSFAAAYVAMHVDGASHDYLAA